MSRRVSLTLVRLLVAAAACAGPVAAASAAPPPNDLRTAATPVAGLGWTKTSSVSVVVQATDWGDATTGPEDADPLPSCSGSAGYRSIWYSLVVPEAAVLRVTVASSDPVRFQPLVNVLDWNNEEVGCGLANDVRQAATANATAYVTPMADGTPGRYLIRVAEVANNSPSGGLPVLTVGFNARDVTPPHIRVTLPVETVAPDDLATYDAGPTARSAGTTDEASQINPATALWEFHDRSATRAETTKRIAGMRVSYRWRTRGAHEVVFTVSDFAGNRAMYRFTTVVQDTVRPDVRFSLRPPAPGARRLRITVDASESVKIRLVMTQAGKRGPLLRRTISFWGDTSHSRSVPLRGIVGKGVLLISGIARDLAGNATALPQCVVDPVTGRGRCISP
jgi:hypothetical protein